MESFQRRVAAVDPDALCATGLDLLQLNVGLRCNMSCGHCHQSSSPAREEQMGDDVFEAALGLARRLGVGLVDVTGGAPELHPAIRGYLEALRGAGLEVQLRTNLTALLEPGAEGLPELLARLGVRLLASLPALDSEGGMSHRVLSVDVAMDVLRRLNRLGYGAGAGLVLDLAHNPEGALLPEPQAVVTQRVRAECERRFGVRFDSLLALTNVPIGRFGAALRAAGRRDDYLAELVAAFNPATVPRLACRRSLVVAWDGTLWDCDFNLGARLPLATEPRTVHRFDERLLSRRIAFGSHCFACTAQAGSS